MQDSDQQAHLPGKGIHPLPAADRPQDKPGCPIRFHQKWHRVLIVGSHGGLDESRAYVGDRDVMHPAFDSQAFKKDGEPGLAP